MYGARKIKIKVNKRKRVFFITSNNRITNVYNKEGNIVLSFNVTYSNCSIVIVQNICSYKEELPGLLISCIQNLGYSGNTIVSIQNITKKTGQDLLKQGFKEYASLPGSYTYDYKVEGVDKNNCMSIMMYTQKNIKKSKQRSLNLLELFN